MPAACDRLWLHGVEHIQAHAFNERLRTEIRHIAEAPATTATDSIFAACRALGA